MAQQQVVRGVKTSIEAREGRTRIVYRGTCVVEFDAREVTLNSGGWRTATTKTRMNQASNQFGLGFRVYQDDHAWHVQLPSGITADYEDGMTFITRRES